MKKLIKRLCGKCLFSHIQVPEETKKSDEDLIYHSAYVSFFQDYDDERKIYVSTRYEYNLNGDYRIKTKRILESRPHTCDLLELTVPLTEEDILELEEKLAEAIKNDIESKLEEHRVFTINHKLFDKYAYNYED